MTNKLEEKLEKMLEESPMNDYPMYVREDLIEFAKVVIEEALYVVDIPLFERNEVRKHFGMEEEPMPASEIGLVTTRDWTK